MLINVNVLNDGIQGRDGEAPYIGENGHWYVWDNDTEQWVDSGVWAGNGPTIVDCIVNADKSITFFFGDGTSYTTPSLKGADGNKIVYYTNNAKNYMEEGYDGEGIYHSATMLHVQLTPQRFPQGYPNTGDYVVTRGGCLFYCNNRSMMYADLVCYANMNGNITKLNELTIDKLFVNNYASIVGFVFKEVVIDNVVHFRIE